MATSNAATNYLEHAILQFLQPLAQMLRQQQTQLTLSTLHLVVQTIQLHMHLLRTLHQAATFFLLAHLTLVRQLLQVTSSVSTQVTYLLS